MKKNRLFFLAVLFISIFTQSAHAQQKFTVGLQGGLGMASAYNFYNKGNAYTSDIELGIPKNYPTLSYMYNLYLSYKINEKYGVALEPGIVRKGYGTKIYNEDVFFNKRRLNYFQLPVLMEFYVDNAFTLTIGPEFGYLLSAKMKSNDDSDSLNLIKLYRKNRFDFGVQLGGFYTFIDHIDVGLKIGGSFTNIEKSYLTDISGNVLTDVFTKNMYANLFTRIKL